MTYIILCEGKTDAFIINLIMSKVGFKYVNKKQGISFKLLKNQSLDYFVKDEDKLLIWNTGGCENLLKAVEEVKKLSKSSTVPIDSLGIVIDKDFNEEDTIVDNISSAFSLDNALKNAIWNKHNYEDDFKEQKSLKVLLNIIPYGEFGALETLMFNSLKNKGVDESRIGHDIEKMIDKLKSDKISFFKKERFVIKAKLGCLINSLDPERTFYDIIDSFEGINWEEDEIVKTHFKELEKYK